MKLRELQRWLILNDAKDIWKVKVADKELPTRFSLAELSCYIAERKNSNVSIQHTDIPIGSEDDWMNFEGEATRTIRHLTRASNTSNIEVANVTKSTSPAPEAKAVEKETADPAVINQLKQRITFLETSLEKVLKDIELLKRPIEEEIEAIEERERFLDISEETLLRKTQELEVQRAEIENLKEINSVSMHLR